MKRYVGVDYHKGYSYMTVMDETGKICGQGQIPKPPEPYRTFSETFSYGPDKWELISGSLK